MQITSGCLRTPPLPAHGHGSIPSAPLPITEAPLNCCQEQGTKQRQHLEGANQGGCCPGMVVFILENTKQTLSDLFNREFACHYKYLLITD